MVSEYLLETAAKNFGFDIGTHKIKCVTNWPDQERELDTFKKNGKDYVLQCWPHFVEQRRQTRAEIYFIDYLAENGISVAPPLKTTNGELVVLASENGMDYNIIAFELVNGLRWNEDGPNTWNSRVFFNWGKTMGDMHRLAKKYNPADRYDVPELTERTYEGWGPHFDRLKAYPQIYKITRELLDTISLLPKDKDSFGLIHGDLHQENFLIDGDRINVFDFNDNIYAWFVLDIGIALFHALWWGRKDGKGNDLTDTIVGNFLKGYLSANRLNGFWFSKIPLFMKYRQICCFIPWFFDPENMDSHNGQQKEWIHSIENDNLFDDRHLASISDIIEKAIS